MRSLTPETIEALDGWSADNAKVFIADQGAVAKNADGTKRIVLDRAWVIQQMYNFTYKDEFEYVHAKIRSHLDAEHLAIFDAMAAEKFTPRSDEVFAQLLEEKRPAGYTPKEA